MPRILTKLRIDEVSAVDRGAGEGVKIVLMKRDDAEPVRDDGGTGSGDHHASVVAELMVERQALLARMNKAEQTAKDPPMDTVHSIMKDGGIAATCAAIVAKGNTSITEFEIVQAVSKIAVERWPQLTEAQGFSKILDASTEEARVLQSALKIAKAAEFAVFDIKPVVVGGADARDVDNATAAAQAYEEITRIAREKFPFLPADQQFARVFEDKNYAALAAQAHRRPSAPAGGVYPYPR